MTQQHETTTDEHAEECTTRPHITRQPTWREQVPYSNFGRALHDKDAGLCVEYLLPSVLVVLVNSMLVLMVICVGGSLTIAILSWQVRSCCAQLLCAAASRCYHIALRIGRC